MKYCYACENDATTREHVPPKCLFPEQRDATDGADFRQDLITVPSCADHNLAKAGDDEYFLYVLNFCIPANLIAQTHVQTKLTRAIRRRPSLAASMLEDCQDCHVVDSATGTVHEAVQVGLDGIRFQRTLELIARGIYYHHYGHRWGGALRVHADFITFPQEPKSAEIDVCRLVVASCADGIFAQTPKQARNQDVFWYQVHDLQKSLSSLMRLCFYGNCKVIAIFGDMSD